MDNLTHTLTGLALAQTGLKRRTRYATWALVVGSNLPDIDAVSRFWGSAEYLKYHRGITHSILGAAVLAGLLAAVIYALGKRASPPRPGQPALNARALALLCLLALEGHVLMDFTNSYGVRLFLPFSGHWYAWDIMFIVDPLLLLILLGGFALPALFRLISEEVGARKPGYQRGATVALVLMVMLWGLRDVAHRRALGMLNAHVYGEQDALRTDAFPSPANPFSWTGVVETDNAYRVLEADVLAGDVDLSHRRIYYKPASSPALEAAENSPTGAIFMDFARDPWERVEPTDKGYVVTLQDLRFVSLRSERQGFVARIELDKNLHVISQAFSFTGRFKTED
jgi:inner membrane protein